MDKHLERIDPSRNMRRYYSVTVEPNLFGDLSVVRRWGRIGTLGREIIEIYDDRDYAIKRSSQIVDRKIKRGYLEP